MFWAAAMTRAVDLINNDEGDSSDVLIMRQIDNMDDIEKTVESGVAEYGLWSHSGLDGPFREDGKGGYDQLSVKDWGKLISIGVIMLMPYFMVVVLVLPKEVSGVKMVKNLLLNSFLVYQI